MGSNLIRPLVRDLHPYVPGEQPKIKGLIKLNTNENPYPPAPRVLRAIRNGVDDRLRLYPNPTAQPVREKLAEFHQCSPENIILGNGSDELLAMAIRAFVEPGGRRRRSRATVQYFHPSYSLYSVLADLHGAHKNPVPLRGDFSIPPASALPRTGYDFKAALTFVTTPNAPGGRGYSRAELERLCSQTRGVVVLDEAYIDFAEEDALPLAFRFPNVIVSRTFSKAYSLCFLRIGYFVASAALIQALDKIRDSYNVNGVAQLAALETLNNLPYYRKNFARVKATRKSLGEQLMALGFEVLPSQANFILAKPPHFSAEQWLHELRERKILVRWFSSPEVKNYLRITIGTPGQARALVKGIKDILKTKPGRR